MKSYLLPCLVLGCVVSVAACEQHADSPQPTDQTQEIRELRLELQRISARLAVLEAAHTPRALAPGASSVSPATAPSAVTAAPPTPVPSPLTEADRHSLDFLNRTTIDVGVDGYYAQNFNHPIGRVNLLRAYDVSSNSFSINQASLIVEHLPRSEAGQRFGGRVDLQFGQATETVQGSAANELRPQVWRNLFQAYGSYLAPVGHGLRIDFGKWASSLGVEGNYTKDQMNYSRSFLFTYLPYYHMGLRANYDVTPRINVGYWLVNGAAQTEDFNSFKSQAFVGTFKPATTVAWTVNYYFGQEQRDVLAAATAGVPPVAPQPGLPISSISPVPSGREHIFDTYATWQATPRLTFVGEADYVINREQPHSAPAHISGGAAYARYTLPRRWAGAARAEYLSDRGGLFSGSTQALKEGTLTLEHQLEPGFVARFEYRRDLSNQRFFLTDREGLRSTAQSTATIGLIYCWGQRQGSW